MYYIYIASAALKWPLVPLILASAAFRLIVSISLNLGLWVCRKKNANNTLRKRTSEFTIALHSGSVIQPLLRAMQHAHTLYCSWSIQALYNVQALLLFEILWPCLTWPPLKDNPSYRIGLSVFLIYERDTFCCPECNVYALHNPINQDTSLNTSVPKSCQD